MHAHALTHLLKQSPQSPVTLLSQIVQLKLYNFLKILFNSQLILVLLNVEIVVSEIRNTN